MKNKIIMVLIIIAILSSFTACDVSETSNNYLRPQNYILVDVDCDGFLTGVYGYIKQEEYDKFLSGDLKGALIILHPFEKGKFVTRAVNKIMGIELEEEY
jgi:hypothetical protein